ncbi:MAG: response regulator, partial [Moorea sp. SIO3C2]|nr:response regulator [Moorena sp. SIO3C2]
MCAAQINYSQPRLLIVDDQPDNLRLLSTMLKDEGYEVRRALSGTLALRNVQAHPPDLILLDINMPELSGYEVCQALKADAKTRSIPIIFL